LYFAVAVLLSGVVYGILLGDPREMTAPATLEFYQAQRQLLAGSDAPSAPGVMLLQALRPAGVFLGNLPFLPLFHAAMFLEDLCFLLGVWLLSSRYYASPRIAFFVTVAAAGSCLWTDQIRANFLAFHIAPLVIFLVHEFLDRGGRQNLLFASLLMLLQGTMAGFLAVVLYFLSVAALLPGELASRIAVLRRNRAGVLWLLAFAACSLWAAIRSPAVAPSAPRWILVDLLLGVSLSPSVTAFCGFFTLGFAGLAVARGERRRTLLLLAVALGSFFVLSRAGDAVPFVRLFLAFLSGAGLDRALREPRTTVVPAAGLMVLAAILAFLTFFCLAARGVLEPVLWPLVGAPSVRVLQSHRLETPLLSELLGAGAFGAGTAGATLYLLSAGFRARPLAVALILLLHPLDVFGWKSRMVWLRTTPAATSASLEQIGRHALSGSSPPTTAASAVMGAISCVGMVLLVRSTLQRFGPGQRGGQA